MNPPEVRQLLDRAAEDVRQRGPVTGSSIRDRAHRQRRQQVSVIAAAAAVVGVVAGVSVGTGGFGNTSSGVRPGGPRHSASPNIAASKAATAPKPKLVSKVSMTLPAGWHQQAVGDDFDPCTAQQNTLYVGGAMNGQNSWGQSCKGNVSQPWAWVMDRPVEAGLLTPQVMVLHGGSMGLVESSVKLDDAALAGTPPAGIPPSSRNGWATRSTCHGPARRSSS